MQSDDTVRIPLRARDGSVRAYAVVDAADAEWVSQRRWYWLCRRYAASRTATRQCILLHREILGLVPGDGLCGDHIDRDTLNNRRSNLRAISQTGNTQNTSKRVGVTSRFRGVSWAKDRGKWRACIKLHGKMLHLGSFDSEKEAAEVARNARLRFLPYATD